jgi:hypothetical protein
LFGIVFLVENNFTTKGTPPTQISYTRNHHNSKIYLLPESRKMLG